MSERHLEVLVPGVSIAEVANVCTAAAWPPGVMWHLLPTSGGTRILLAPGAGPTLALLAAWPFWTELVDSVVDACELGLWCEGRRVYGEGVAPTREAWVVCGDDRWTARVDDAPRELDAIASARARAAARDLGIEVVPARRAWEAGDAFPGEPRGPIITVGHPEAVPEDDDVPW